jgi:hypothetical protein
MVCSILAHLNPLIVCVQRNIVATPYGWYGRSCQCKSFYTAEAQWIENKFCMITSSHCLGLLCQISSFQKWREIPGVLHYNIYVNQQQPKFTAVDLEVEVPLVEVILSRHCENPPMRHNGISADTVILGFSTVFSQTIACTQCAHFKSFVFMLCSGLSISKVALYLLQTQAV